MSLSEVVSKLKNFSEEKTIYAKKPWTENSKALVLNEPLSGGLPQEAEKENLTYFLEVSIANEFLEGWAANSGLKPTSMEGCKRLIDYAINDA